MVTMMECPMNDLQRSSTDLEGLAGLMQRFRRPEQIPTASGVIMVTSPSACPWPGSMREQKCKECRDCPTFSAINWHQSLRYQYDASDCLQEQVRQAAEAAAERERIDRELRQPERLLARCGLKPAEMTMTFERHRPDRWNREVYEELMQWNPSSGRGFYLWGKPDKATNPGGTGTGKTFALCALTVWLCKNGIPCLFSTVGDFLDELRSTYNKGNDADDQEIIQRYSTVDVLCWDDLGKEALPANSDWPREKIYAVVNNRARAGLPMVVSSNLILPKGVEERFGSEYGYAIASRLAALCNLRQLGGPDKRYQSSRL